MDDFDYFFEDESVNMTMTLADLYESSDDESEAPTKEEGDGRAAMPEQRCEDCGEPATDKTCCEECAGNYLSKITLANLRQQEYAKGSPIYHYADRMEKMHRNGVGICDRCVGIGPVDEICVSCADNKTEDGGIFYYATPESVLQAGQGVCFVCSGEGGRVIGPVGHVCRCSHGIFTAIPSRPDGGSFEMMENPSKEEQDDNSRDYVVMSLGCTPRRTQRLPGTRKYTKSWLLDTGATLHVTNNENYIKDPVDVYKTITVGNGETVTATKQGWVEIDLGGGRMMRLLEVVFVPNFMKNIISVNKLCKN